MIEISAKLTREQTPVFLCGEMVECIITISNPSLPEHRLAQSNNDVLENLAWASAQINCYRSSSLSNEKQNGLSVVPGTRTETSLSGTSSGLGDIVLSTDPKILFCDLRLAPGESKTYLYGQSIPIAAPPTYRGLWCRYTYKLTIATQRVGSRVQFLRVPMRVLPLPTLIQAEDAQLLACCDETHEDLAPTNPFLEKRKSQTKFELALNHLQNVTARRRPNFYLISNKRGCVGRFCIFKSAYKLGEDIVGTLDFTCRTVRCVQVSVTLQSQEYVLAKRGNVVASNANATTDASASESTETGKVLNFTKYHEVCLGLWQTQVILPVPLHATPTFETDFVKHRWKLHFEFVTTNAIETPSDDANYWQAPNDITIETMVWNLPVTLYPTTPLQIYQHSGTHKLVIK